MDFGWPNAEIGWKMANGRLLFLALPHICACGNLSLSNFLANSYTVNTCLGPAENGR